MPLGKVLTVPWSSYEGTSGDKVSFPFPLPKLNSHPWFPTPADMRGCEQAFLETPNSKSYLCKIKAEAPNTPTTDGSQNNWKRGAAGKSWKHYANEGKQMTKWGQVLAENPKKCCFERKFTSWRD